MTLEQGTSNPGRAPGASGPAASATLQRELRDHWKGYVFHGILMIVAGALAILAPFAATLASTLFFGWLLVFVGIAGIVAAFASRQSPGFLSRLALSVLALILGGVILYNPAAGAVTLTWAMAAYFMLSGFLNFSFSGAAPGGRNWWLVISGIIDVALAVFLILGLPGTAVWALGLFIGISFLSSGIALLFAAISARRAG